MGMGNETNAPVIKLKGLKKSFGIGDAERFALNGIDLIVDKGEFIVIMGPSGCGKTTLLNILGLLLTSSEGEHHVNGEPITQISKRRQARIRSQQIGFIFQSFNLIPRLNIIENVALPLLYSGGMGSTKRLERASDLLKNFHLGEREYYMPHQLSGGQVQRVAIARALMNDPSLILADEPTGNLDTHSSHIVMEELANLHKKGNTIIMVTHNPELTTYASRVITMRDGMIHTDSKNDIFRAETEHRNIFQPAAPEVKKPLNTKAAKKTKTVATESKPNESFELPDIEEFVIPKTTEPEPQPKPKKKNRKPKNKKTTANQTAKKSHKKSKNKSSAKRNKQ